MRREDLETKLMDAVEEALSRCVSGEAGHISDMHVFELLRSMGLFRDTDAWEHDAKVFLARWFPLREETTR